MPRSVPIAEYAPGWCELPGEDDDGPWNAFIGEIDGMPAWSDGRVLLMGNTPACFEIKIARSFAKPLDNCRRSTLAEVTPAVVAEIAGFVAVLFSDGTIIKARFYDIVRWHFPSCVW